MSDADYSASYRRDLASGFPKTVIAKSIRQRIEDTKALSDDTPDKLAALRDLTEFLAELDACC